MKKTELIITRCKDLKSLSKNFNCKAYDINHDLMKTSRGFSTFYKYAAYEHSDIFNRCRFSTNIFSSFTIRELSDKKITKKPIKTIFISTIGKEILKLTEKIYIHQGLIDIDVVSNMIDEEMTEYKKGRYKNDLTEIKFCFKDFLYSENILDKIAKIEI